MIVRIEDAEAGACLIAAAGQRPLRGSATSEFVCFNDLNGVTQALDASIAGEQTSYLDKTFLHDIISNILLLYSQQKYLHIFSLLSAIASLTHQRGLDHKGEALAFRGSYFLVADAIHRQMTWPPRPRCDVSFVATKKRTTGICTENQFIY